MGAWEWCLPCLLHISLLFCLFSFSFLALGILWMWQDFWGLQFCCTVGHINKSLLFSWSYISFLISLVWGTAYWFQFFFSTLPFVFYHVINWGKKFWCVHFLSRYQICNGSFFMACLILVDVFMFYVKLFRCSQYCIVHVLYLFTFSPSVCINIYF